MVNTMSLKLISERSAGSIPVTHTNIMVYTYYNIYLCVCQVLIIINGEIIMKFETGHRDFMVGKVKHRAHRDGVNVWVTKDLSIIMQKKMPSVSKAKKWLDSPSIN